MPVPMRDVLINVRRSDFFIATARFRCINRADSFKIETSHVDCFTFRMCVSVYQESITFPSSLECCFANDFPRYQ